MAVTDKVLQNGPSGLRVVPDAGVVEVGAGIVSTTGGLSVDAQAGAAVIVNDAQVNQDFLVRGQGDANLLVVDGSADAIGIGVAAPSSLLDVGGAITVQGTAAPALSAAGTGRFYFDSGSNAFLFSSNGGAYESFPSGTGASGQITYWTGAGSLSGEADLFWDEGNNRLGVRTATPSVALQVQTGQIGAPNGTAGSPSYTFHAETDNGLYRAGTDDTRWVAGGQDRVLVRAGGVTLQGPTEEITSGAGTTLRVRMNNAGAAVDAKRWAFSFDSAVNNNELRLVTETDALAQTPVLAIDRNGQVGIGSSITTPGARLDVRGSVIINEDAGNNDVRIEGQGEPNLLFTDASADRVGIATATPAAKLNILEINGAVNGTRGLRLDNPNGDIVMLEIGSGGDSYVGTRSTSAFSLRYDNVARVTANASGLVINNTNASYDFQVKGAADNNLLFGDASTDRIGIGTASPAGKVEIRDDTATTNLILGKAGAGAGNNDILEFRTEAFTAGERHVQKWTSGSGATVVGRYGMTFDNVTNTQDFVWRDMFNVTTTTVENMRLKGNGNLGLGTASPNSRFDLAGAFNIRGISAPSVSPAGQGRIYFDSSTNKWRISENGGAYQDLLAVGGVGGSGTAGQMAFWTAGSTLAGDSDLVWDSTNNRLGIAVGASPNTGIDMTGAFSLRGISAPAVSPAGQGRLYFDSSTNKWRISENGSSYQDLLGASGVSGSGSVNRIAFWNGATVLTSDAQLYWDNTNNYFGADQAAPTSTMDVGGSLATAVTTLSANTNLDDTHHTILGDASGGAFTLTLPTASTVPGREYRVKKIDSASDLVTVARSGSDTIDGATQVTLGSQYEVRTFVSNGTNWFVF